MPKPIRYEPVPPAPKLPYRREVAGIVSLIRDLYPDCKPRNLDPAITAIYKLLEKQSNDIALEQWLSKTP